MRLTIRRNVLIFFNLSIENNSSEQIYVRENDGSINGIMAVFLLSETIPAGEKLNTAIKIYDSEMAFSLVDEIANIEFNFKIQRGDDKGEIIDFLPISIDTSIAETYEYNVELLEKPILNIVI